MNKNRIRLTESQLHRIIKESVKKILKEEKSIDRGRFVFYERSTGYLIKDTEMATSYYYDVNKNSWERNATPDFSETAQQALPNIVGQDVANRMLKSINAIENARLEKRKQEKEAEQAAYNAKLAAQQEIEKRNTLPNEKAYNPDQELWDKSQRIKNGERIYVTEREADLMVRRGWVKVEDLERIGLEAPGWTDMSGYTMR